MKKKIALRMEAEVDSLTGKVEAVYFYIRPGTAAETREYAEGRALADYDRWTRIFEDTIYGRSTAVPAPTAPH